MIKKYLYWSITLISIVMTTPAHADFAGWKNQIQETLISSGLPKDFVKKNLDAIKYDHRIVLLDRKQPEGRMSLQTYLDKTITPERIRKGRIALQNNSIILRDVEKKYGIPPEIIVALWGKETSYGGYVGSIATLNALATLAYDGRRRELFENELQSAFRLMYKNKWPITKLKGSWAGALGQCQFMPSTYLKHGVDADHDGYIDLWTSMDDIFYSMANLLKNEGWQTGQKYHSGTENYNVLKRWNRSDYFATAVGQLADKISN
jgi:lytic murein transglycosylase